MDGWVDRHTIVYVSLQLFLYLPPQLYAYTADTKSPHSALTVLSGQHHE